MDIKTLPSPKEIKGHVLPIHTPIPIPQDPASNTPLEKWDPGIPVTDQNIPNEEKDLFLAKTITLCSKLEYPIKNWMRSIRETPIVRVVKSGEEQEDTVTLQQMLPQGILVEISFKRGGAHRLLSVPLKESFHLSKKPCNAHPLPHQHTGWALSEELFLPSEALAAEKVNFITKLAHTSLLEGASEHALPDKQKAFRQNPGRLLERHCMLAHALESASQLPSPPGVIDTYFASLNEKEGWNHLTHLYEAINCILQKKLTHKETSLDPAERYTKWMVQLLRQGAEHPETRFGKQLQEIYSFQLSHFLHAQGQTHQSPQQVAEQMVEALDKEIEILQRP